LQKIAVGWWRVFGVKTKVFQMKWSDRELFSEKIARLSKEINILHTKGETVSLVGVSAGASAVLAAFVKNKAAVTGMVFICGKLNRPETVGQSYYDQNPAFRDAMNQLRGSVSQLTKADKTKVLSIAPLYDQTVPVEDMKINGAHQKIIPTLWHVPSIVLAVTVFSPLAIFFLKRKVTMKV
jgi:hypothetical protein